MTSSNQLPDDCKRFRGDPEDGYDYEWAAEHSEHCASCAALLEGAVSMPKGKLGEALTSMRAVRARSECPFLKNADPTELLQHFLSCDACINALNQLSASKIVERQAVTSHEQVPDICKGFRVVLERANPRFENDRIWDAAESHADACSSCASYLERCANEPLSSKEKQVLSDFVAEERVWRTCCPSIEKLRAHAGEAGDVLSHLGHCEPCQEEHIRLLAGEDVVRRVPKIELPDLSKLNRPKPDTPPG